ncbi:maleylpyruvate isomerase family mycothiol-dependent enzyme [soil metagenome]
MNTIERDVRGAVAAHECLLASLKFLTDAEARSASLLPDWTVGHVLTHIARNADGFVLMVEAANRGEIGMQYPGGLEGRNADIENGATRSAAELTADVSASCERLEAAWAGTTPAGWDGTGQTLIGSVPINALPFRRWREAAVHHADCGFEHGGVSFSWRDWPSDYVRLELEQMTMLWASRKPMGLTALPARALAVDDRQRLAWLMGRATIDDLAPAGIY